LSRRPFESVSRTISREEAHAKLQLLRSYLERHYNIKIVNFSRLDRGVYRIDRDVAPSWVVRIFPEERPSKLAVEDAEILRYLESEKFPAETCATSNATPSPRGRSLLLTKFVSGVKPEKNVETLTKFGDLIGQIFNLHEQNDSMKRPAGSLHHYSLSGGYPKTEIDTAISWLEETEEKFSVVNATLHKSLKEQLVNVDDLHDLPSAFLHPDPVMKNLIQTPENNLVLIDWTGAGTGPRLSSIAVLIWSSALTGSGWSPEFVDAVVEGLNRRIVIQESELEYLHDAIMIRQLVFAAWRYRHAYVSGVPPDGKEWWWPSEFLTHAISSRAKVTFRHDLKKDFSKN
jgi:Ser/Thr protein kinase RdoA (MazF antagonist)